MGCSNSETNKIRSLNIYLDIPDTWASPDWPSLGIVPPGLWISQIVYFQHRRSPALGNDESACLIFQVDSKGPIRGPKAVGGDPRSRFRVKVGQRPRTWIRSAHESSDGAAFERFMIGPGID